jgi:hypothetical protein
MSIKKIDDSDYKDTSIAVAIIVTIVCFVIVG